MKWNREVVFDKFLKTDFVGRDVSYKCNEKPPKCKWLDWDTLPLGKWEYKPPTLKEVTERGMDGLAKLLEQLKKGHL